MLAREWKCYNQIKMDISQAGYSALDRPEILQFIFYPRRDFTKTPTNAIDYFIPVDKDVSISCRFYTHSRSAPSIMYFHGNGEVVSDYDSIAPLYDKLGINLFVVDYRGYGASGGTPSFSSMIADAPILFGGLTHILLKNSYK